jgi:hypothetical protein
MKKQISILIIITLLFSGINAVAFSSEDSYDNLVNDNISFSSLTVTQKDECIKIELDGCNAELIRESKPVLPMTTKVYTFPLGTTIEDVSVNFGEVHAQTISKKIAPSPITDFISTMYPSKEISEIVDYSDLSLYPEKRYEYATHGGIESGDHVTFLKVKLYPVQYNPNVNRIDYVKNIDIEISYNLPVESMFTTDEYDFLVLSPAEFTNALQPLIDYKNNDGLSTVLKTLDEIPETGNDTPESIKLFIKDAVEDWGVDYVLIVGSWVEHRDESPDPQFAKFPIRKAYIPSGNYESWFPSDLYYADLYDGNGSFSTWDADGDGKYAEITSFSDDTAAMDLIPDVALGRLPCTTESEVTAMVNKIITYEEHNKMTNKIVQIGGDTFPGDPEEVNEGEFANKEVLTNLPGYESIRLWASQSDGADELSKRNIANGFNGNVDFVDFSGHGSYASWATHAPQDDGTWLPDKTVFSPYTGWLYIDYDLFMVNNQQKHPVVVFNACSCSKYSDSPQCMSWSSIRGNTGGIASFGASGIGYGSYGTSETERVWGWMEVNIFKGIYEDKILGDVWRNCITEYTTSFIGNESDLSDYKTVVEMTLFGDPTLGIEDGKDPKIHSLDSRNIIQVLERFLQQVPGEKLISNLINYLFR